MPVDKNIPLRKGDIVNLRATVEYASACNETLKVMVGYTTLYPEREDVELVQPKFNVGERALTEDGVPCEIKAIVDTEAWIETENGAWIAYLSDLRRAPALVQADGQSYNAAVLALPSANDPDDAAIGAIGPDEDEPHWTVGPTEVAEGVTVRRPDGTLETSIGEFKPVEGPDPLKAVLENLNREPNVNDRFLASLDRLDAAVNKAKGGVDGGR
jgi:hypothetical protein